jgi:hypothetical protein
VPFQHGTPARHEASPPTTVLDAVFSASHVRKADARQRR